MPKIQRSTLFISACIALLLAPVPADSSRTLPVTFRQMLEVFGGDAYVRAEVTDKEVVYLALRHIDDWGKETESETIFTRYRLTLRDVLHGRHPGSEFDLYLPGGTIDGVNRHVSASFELEIGWEVVLFLEHDELNGVHFSAGTADTVFVGREIDGQEVFVNLDHLPDVALNRNALSKLRTDIALDDLTRDPEEPSILTFETLKAMFSKTDSDDVPRDAKN